MSHYDEQRDMYEQKLKEAKPVQTTFEQNVAKLVNLSDANIKQHYEYQVEIYTKYVDHLKQSSENSDELAFFEGLVQKNLECIAYIDQNSPLRALCNALQCSWNTYDISRMVVFQEQASAALNVFFQNMEKMVEIEKYIDQVGDMVGEYNPTMFNIKRSVN